jgi:hypothetical protein
LSFKVRSRQRSLDALGEGFQRNLEWCGWLNLRQAFVQLAQFEFKGILALDQFRQGQRLSLVSIQQPLSLLTKDGLPLPPLVDFMRRGGWLRLKGHPGGLDLLRIAQQFSQGLPDQGFNHLGAHRAGMPSHTGWTMPPAVRAGVGQGAARRPALQGIAARTTYQQTSQKVRSATVPLRKACVHSQSFLSRLPDRFRDQRRDANLDPFLRRTGVVTRKLEPSLSLTPGLSEVRVIGLMPVIVGRTFVGWLA